MTVSTRGHYGLPGCDSSSRGRKPTRSDSTSGSFRVLPNRRKLGLFSTASVASLLITGMAAARGTPAYASPSSCPAECVNGGECRTQGPVEVAPGPSASSSTSSSFYCHCPRGYWGPRCEIQFVMCLSGNETCFSGEPCYRDIDHDGEPYYHCQCDISSASSTDMSSPYTYRLCPHAATTFCNRKKVEAGTGSLKNGTSTATKKQGSGQDVSLGPAGGSYCANAGKCKPQPPIDSSSSSSKKQLHAGCDCPPGWTGSYCEIPIGYEREAEAAAAALAPSETAPRSRSILGSIVRGILSGLAILVVGIGLMVWFYTGREGVLLAWSWIRHHVTPRRRFAGVAGSGAKRAAPEPGVELAPTFRDSIDDQDLTGADGPPANGHAIA